MPFLWKQVLFLTITLHFLGAIVFFLSGSPAGKPLKGALASNMPKGRCEGKVALQLLYFVAKPLKSICCYMGKKWIPIQNRQPMFYWKSLLVVSKCSNSLLAIFHLTVMHSSCHRLLKDSHSKLILLELI